MVRSYRTGPKGQGPGIGRQMGRGEGRGRGESFRTGPGGYCICLSCGKRVLNKPEMPCFMIRCPRCGFPMTQELILKSQ